MELALVLPLVGVVHQRFGLARSPQRHHQSINDQLGRHAPTHGLAHRTAGIQVQHHSIGGQGYWPQCCVKDVERYPRAAYCVGYQPLAGSLYLAGHPILEAGPAAVLKIAPHDFLSLHVLQRPLSGFVSGL